MKKRLVSMLMLLLICFMASCGTSKDISSDEGQSTISVVDSSSEESSEESSDDESSINPAEQPMTKEEMLDLAEEVMMNTIVDEISNNAARAKLLYCNKILLLEGEISDISTDHLTIGRGTIAVNVYLPMENLVDLGKYQKVTIVGKTEDDFTIISESYDGFSFDSIYLNIPTAYLVADTYETTGTLRGKNTSYDDAYNIKIDDDPVLRLIYFADGVNIPENNGEITFSSKLFYKYVMGGSTIEYRDAVIIE